MKSTRRTLLGTVGGAAALGVGGVGSVTARSGASGDQTIVDVAMAADDFDVLVEAVKKAGLVEALNGDRQLTVFAPTDAAFAALLDSLGGSGLNDFPAAKLRSILLYHVTPGRRNASSVVRASSVDTLNGADIAVDGTTLDDGQAEIVATDIEASNGVIHVINGVLLP